MTPELLGILAYIVLQLGIGFVVSRTIRTQEDYLVAGRSLGYGLAIFTIFATWFGAETCVSSAGAIAKIDVSKLSLFAGGEAEFLDVLEAWSIPICGSVVAQELVARILATRTPTVARRSAVIAAGSVPPWRFTPRARSWLRRACRGVPRTHRRRHPA